MNQNMFLLFALVVGGVGTLAVVLRDELQAFPTQTRQTATSGSDSPIQGLPEVESGFGFEPEDPVEFIDQEERYRQPVQPPDAPTVPDTWFNQPVELESPVINPEVPEGSEQMFTQPVEPEPDQPQYTQPVEPEPGDLQVRIQLPEGRARRNNNPGNLKYAGQTHATGQDVDGFARFPDMITGWDALKAQIRLDQSRGFTFYEFIHKYAPQYENPTNEYLTFVINQVGARSSDQIKNYPAPRIAKAITEFETGGSVELGQW